MWPEVTSAGAGLMCILTFFVRNALRPDALVSPSRWAEGNRSHGTARPHVTYCVFYQNIAIEVPFTHYRYLGRRQTFRRWFSGLRLCRHGEGEVLEV